MLTNAYDTQVVGSLGVQVAGAPVLEQALITRKMPQIKWLKR